MSRPVSRRQELLNFTSEGRLRDAVADAGLPEEAVELLLDIVFRYCERRKPRGSKPRSDTVGGYR